MANVELTSLKLSSWRKIALGSWNNGGDPSVYGSLDFNATKIRERQARYAERTGERAPTITAIVARAAAITLHEHPQINGLLRWGKIYNRKTVTLFLQAAVDDAGQDLSGVVIENAEKKSVAQIFGELQAKARAIREDKDPNFRQAKGMFGVIPWFLTRWVLNTMSFFLYTLNWNLTWLGLPRDPFGSVMITSIGSLGLEEAYAPLVPYSRVPLLLAVGAIRDQAVVEAGQIRVAPVFKMCITFDHRFVDGVHGAKMVKTCRRLLETDAGLDALGL